jgi:hypothetical protein
LDRCIGFIELNFAVVLEMRGGRDLYVWKNKGELEREVDIKVQAGDGRSREASGILCE